MDSITGLYHMGARFYDPTIGRWLSEDPGHREFNPASLNYNVYVNNNPANFVDPAGKDPVVWEISTGVAIAIPGVGEAIIVAGGIILGGIAIYEGFQLGRQIYEMASRDRRISAVKEALASALNHIRPDKELQWVRHGSHVTEVQETVQRLQDIIKELEYLIETARTPEERKILERELEIAKNALAAAQEALRNVPGAVSPP